MRLNKFRVIVAVLLIVSLVYVVTAADPWVILCKKLCRESRDDCLDAAYIAYVRCKRVSEEAQCRDDYEFQKSICWVEYDDCLNTCS